MYWLNKAWAWFADAQTDPTAFAHIQPESPMCRAFATATAYEPTLALLDQARRWKP